MNLWREIKWDRQHPNVQIIQSSPDLGYKNFLFTVRKEGVLEGELTFMRAAVSLHQGDSCVPPSSKMFSNIQDRSTSTILSEPTRCGGSNSAAEGVVNGSAAMDMQPLLCCPPRRRERARCADAQTRAWSLQGGSHHSHDHVGSRIGS